MDRSSAETRPNDIFQSTMERLQVWVWQLQRKLLDGIGKTLPTDEHGQLHGEIRDASGNRKLAVGWIRHVPHRERGEELHESRDRIFGRAVPVISWMFRATFGILTWTECRSAPRITESTWCVLPAKAVDGGTMVATGSTSTQMLMRSVCVLILFATRILRSR